MSPQPVTTPVRPAHRFDERALGAYLADHLDGFDPPFSVVQFEGGQSNPTFLLEDGESSYVVRKKPPGKLLPSAHAVEREFRVMRALQDTPVPVCRMLLLCEDSSVIGTPFIVMEHVPGRVYHDPTLPGMQAGDRRAVYRHSCEILSALHSIEPDAVGLARFGWAGNYYARQISRWSRQYQASRTEDLPEMELLMDWLPRHIPRGEESRIVHGDYRLGNAIVHPSVPRISAVLDWELSTLGDPLADLAYNLMTYFLPARRHPTLAGNIPAETGIPSLREQLDAYRDASGRDPAEHWGFYLAFSMFRSAAIGQGVYKRGLDGNASSDTALELGREVASTAGIAWDLATGARDPLGR